MPNQIYYQRWKAKKLAADPDFFKHDYQKRLARYGRAYNNKHVRAWQEKHPNYFAEWRNKNKEYHSERVQKWMQTHPEVANAHSIADTGRVRKKIAVVPMAEFCEVCPEDDIRNATGKHHPDYNYPTIIVSCCDSCHYYLNKEKSKKKDEP